MIYTIVCTRDNNLTNSKSNLYNYLSEAGITLIEKVGASSIFSAYKEAVDQLKDDDYLIFCHDDINILSNSSDLKNLLKEYLEYKNTGFIGPAGTTYMDLDAVWWNHDRWAKKLHKGLVFHGKDILSIKETTYYGPYGRVAILDGLFLAARVGNIRKIRFEKPSNFEGNWDFYDIYFTAQSHLKGLHNYALPILILHNSMGELVGRDSWHKNRIAFISMYHNRFPIKV